MVTSLGCLPQVWTRTSDNNLLRKRSLAHWITHIWMCNIYRNSMTFESSCLQCGIFSIRIAWPSSELAYHYIKLWLHQMKIYPSRVTADMPHLELSSSMEDFACAIIWLGSILIISQLMFASVWCERLHIGSILQLSLPEKHRSFSGPPQNLTFLHRTLNIRPCLERSIFGGNAAVPLGWGFLYFGLKSTVRAKKLTSGTMPQ